MAKSEQAECGRGTPWLTPLEAADYLGVALGTLRNWTSARFVPFARRGRVVRYHRDQLDAWLRRGECVGRQSHAAEVAGPKGGVQKS